MSSVDGGGYDIPPSIIHLEMLLERPSTSSPRINLALSQVSYKELPVIVTLVSKPWPPIFFPLGALESYILQIRILIKSPTN